VQINYADEGATLSGKVMGLSHRYQLYGSLDGRRWKCLVDKSANTEDVPHDYVEFSIPVYARYLKLVNGHVPTGKFALSGLRVFGKINAHVPPAVTGFSVQRSASDRRVAELSWERASRAYAYNLRYGVAPDKLYTSILVHDSTHYTFRGMSVGQEYFFSIQPVGEGGAGKESEIVPTGAGNR
jgi:xylan 1,4-beta-xylosidase